MNKIKTIRSSNFSQVHNPQDVSIRSRADFGWSGE